MANFDEFSKKDKSEKITIAHIEPLKQIIRFTDEGSGLFSKNLNISNSKNNSLLIGLIRDSQELIKYDSSMFLEDSSGNPFLTHDNQFLKLV